LLGGAVLLLIGLPVGVVWAQCDFHHPTAAQKMKVALVQEFVPCGVGCPDWEPSDTPNTFTENGIPGCTPPRTWRAADGWRFGPRGSGSLQLKALRKPPVREGMPPSEGVDFSIRLTLTGVEDDSGPVNSFGGVRMTVRLTSANAQNGDMTVIDLPVYFSFRLENGRARLKTTFDAGWARWAQPPLPACTSVAMPRIQILDDQSEPFAVPGLYLR
jgi:hypothetical protein